MKLQRLFVETLLLLIKEGERRGMKLPMGEGTHLPSGNPCANLPLYHEKQNKLRVKGNVKNIRFAPQFNSEFLCQNVLHSGKNKWSKGVVDLNLGYVWVRRRFNHEY